MNRDRLQGEVARLVGRARGFDRLCRSQSLPPTMRAQYRVILVTLEIQIGMYNAAIDSTFHGDAAIGAPVPDPTDRLADFQACYEWMKQLEKRLQAGRAVSRSEVARFEQVRKRMNVGLPPDPTD